MKVFLIASFLSLVGSCATEKYSTKIQNLKDNIKISDTTTIRSYANTITSTELKNLLYTYASKEFEGRGTGEEGQKKAANFLKTYYLSQNISSPINDSVYFQTIPKSYFPDDTKETENVVAYIEGIEKPEEVLVISAHYDHLGIEDDQIYYGADDDGSGTVALMEMAQAFKMAAKDGFGPKRSILFLHLTAEEIGLQGSRFYTENPIFQLSNTIANLNIDMIGRVDAPHENNSNYLYLIGTDRLSKELHLLSEKVNETFFNLDIDYRFNDEDDKNRYYYRSDHYNFALHNIPVIFYFNGEHEDYHQPTDTPDKINYPLLEKRTQLIFATAWQLANRENRLILNENM
ncbi:MAG: peptidase M28 [Xanthomarina sp.]|uniref:M28 family metallopeptidase n=1 Tax=Xanthomarina sp. TaxID=1931211 RepID=UPI000C535241|nr:M28 family metallopeptidase [Xanthomarina sp.]MBF61780.1 peptidase M28 [Xanthomarina sp.]HAI16761.1 peptidase M28 [Xanthomarina gelatinilytica]|tara:strand:+ start:237 stop:1274 length:1038 start_codon:yes stop_codon:yes gene_type:complete